MRALTLGRTGRQVSEIGFGAWQIGADWGDAGLDAVEQLRPLVPAGATLDRIAAVYAQRLAPYVHQRW
jgi:aryl-alcohol dehydrogenase-like predicted oxidoreductase